MLGDLLRGVIGHSTGTLQGSELKITPLGCSREADHSPGGSREAMKKIAVVSLAHV
jgi:hypothetical protein